jgi:hypothetical protein
MIQLPTWLHLALAWCAFALLVIYVAKYGLGKRKVIMAQFSRGLAVRYMFAVGLIFWPLLVNPTGRYVAIAPLLPVIIGLTMVQYGSRIERLGDSYREKAGSLIGNGGGWAASGLLLALVILCAASFLGAA